MLNVKLDKEMEEKLNSYSLNNNLSKTNIVKEALALFFNKKAEIPQSAYELGADLFSLAGSGNPDSSTTYKNQLKQSLHKKHTH